MESLNRGWLYGLIVMLSQTCNPDYQQPSPYSNNGNTYDDQAIEIPAEALEFEDVIEVEPPRTVEEAPPPPPMPQEEMVFKVVEQMPRFPGCENETNRSLRKSCSEQEMLKFLYSRIKYPQEARKNGVEGKVIVQFVVAKNGDIEDVRVLRDPGAGCGEEAVRIIKLMPKWIPGIQRGKPVRVQYNLPIKFSL